MRVPREDMLDAYASVAPDGPHSVADLLLLSGVCMCHKKVNGSLLLYSGVCMCEERGQCEERLCLDTHAKLLRMSNRTRSAVALCNYAVKAVRVNTAFQG